MRCHLKEKKIASIKATEKRQEFWDISLPGFGLRVTNSGHKSFFFMCRTGGQQKRITLGRYPILSLSDARVLAREKMRLVSQGLPVEEVQQNILTVEEAFNLFIELYAKKRNKDWKRAQGRLKQTFIKEYKDCDIKNISRKDIISLLDKIVARDALTQANRVHAGVSKFLKWCVERGYIDNSPALHISKPSKENKRDRALSDGELLSVWRASEQMDFPFGPIIQLLILTGQRKNEVAGMRWSEINLKERIWLIPKERAKNGKAHAVPLSQAVINIIEKLPRFLHSDLVFTTTGITPVSGFGRVKSRLDQSSGVTDWIIHDLRRTAATGMASLKVSQTVVEKILNHISGSLSGVAGIYNRYHYEDDKRHALDVWANYVERLVLNGRHTKEYFKSQRSI